MLRSPVLLSIILFAGMSAAENADKSQYKAYVLCKSRKEVRTIRIEVGATGVCTTIYSKQGIEKSVGSGKHFESCLTYLNNVKTNLEKSNWTCRDISSSKVTGSLN